MRRKGVTTDTHIVDTRLSIIKRDKSDRVNERVTYVVLRRHTIRLYCSGDKFIFSDLKRHVRRAEELHGNECRIKVSRSERTRRDFKLLI